MGRAPPIRPLALLEALGVAVRPRAMGLRVGEERRAEALASLRAAGWEGEPLLAVAPGSNYATKIWPENHYEALLDRALGETGLRPALYGGPREDALIGRLLRGRPRVLDRRDRGVHGLVADFSHASVFLGNDSGPAHIARALGVPAVVLFGPTDENGVRDGGRFRVLAEPLACRPCSPRGGSRCPLGHHRCMKELAPDRVLRALLEEARIAMAR